MTFSGSSQKDDNDADQNTDNTRFTIHDEELVPATVRARGGKAWVAEEIDESGRTQKEASMKLEAKAKKIKRNRLAYSGISA